MNSKWLTSNNLLYFLDLNQAEFLMSCFKQLVEKQNSENQNLQDKNCSLERENKILADKNAELLAQIKK